MPPEAHTWLQNYEKHLDWREKIDEMRARLFGPSQQGASEQRGEGPAHAASQTDTMRSRTGIFSSSLTGPSVQIPLKLECCKALRISGMICTVALQRGPRMHLQRHWQSPAPMRGKPILRLACLETACFLLFI